ncbi:unnamed protein product [Cuscuta epithymum]|uniref:Ty3 transposon capsid-like protein domain-containing protein n=1 Tax=Cuscuta epithymum TaxID=186058 RepID=A0AAV0FD17_9ASTE|nr:unnamed protein product [Cuscuta epithymum]
MVLTRLNMEQRLDSLERSFERSKEEMRTELGAMNESLQMLLEKMQNLETQGNRRKRRGRSATPRRRQTSASVSSSSSGGNSHDSKSVSRTPEHTRINDRVYTGRKVDLPLFSGNDAYGWLLRVERYFKLNHVLEGDKVEVVLIAMTERALNWYQWWDEQTDDHSWGNFKEALIRRFQPELVQNPFGPMLKIKQTNSVMEYRDHFERVVAPLKIADPEMLKGVFFNGLKEEISSELKLHRPTGLTDLMDTAQLVEQKNKVWTGETNKEEDNKGLKEHGGKLVKAWNWVEATKGRTTAPERTLSENKLEESPKPNKTWESGQRLTQADLEERSKKGLCFKCGNKWGKEHVCGMKNYQLIWMEEPEEEKGTEDQLYERDEAENLLKPNGKSVSYHPP